MVGRRRGRFPSKEELELWAKVTRRDEPLAWRRRAAPESTAPQAPEPERLAEPLENPAEVLNPPALSLKPGPKTRSKQAEPPPPQPFDPRAAKRIARGRRDIDARLDLHGMRQSDAHAALRRFLAHCQAEGHRHVLIITGKGSSTEAEDARRDFWNSEQRGVLRRLVPLWLCEPSMRVHVVSFTESAIKHGGSGALYVTIRKSSRSGT